MRGNDIEAKACIEQAQFFPAGQVQRLCRLVNQMTDDGTGSAAFLIRWPHHNRRQFVRPIPVCLHLSAANQSAANNYPPYLG